MNKEPEVLTTEELLRIENIQLRREVVTRMDEALVRDIAHARMLTMAEYGKTWGIENGRILHAAVRADCVDEAQAVAEEIAADIAVVE